MTWISDLLYEVAISIRLQSTCAVLGAGLGVAGKLEHLASPHSPLSSNIQGFYQMPMDQDSKFS